MKIAIIRRKFNPFGGAEQFITRTIEGLGTFNIQASIIAESWTKTDDAPTLAGQDWIKAGVRGSSRAAKFLSFQQSVAAILSMHKFDLIQSHERLLGADIYRLGDGIHASWVARLAKVSPWYTKLWLKIDPYHRAVIRTEKEMSKEPHLTYVANSKLVQQELMDWYSVPTERIVLIENGIDTKAFAPAIDKTSAKAKLGLNPQLPTVLFVGSGFARKGAFELLEAVKTLTDFQLIIVGYDKQLAKLKKRVKTMQLESRVLVTGPQKDVKPFLAAADLFCLPSLYDPFPNAVLEALCCALPVVVTDSVGIADAIKQRNAGALCVKQAASIADALQHVWQNRESMSQNALNLSQNYDLAKASQQWLSLYNTLIKNKKESSIAHSTH
ncbi:MAG: glycosyltransferase family 4 protein [Bdellovibrio sp.]|nr:glycosyltransferase family 4 protein [Methylotenera sp.]